MSSFADAKNVVLKSKTSLLLKVKIRKIVWSQVVLSGGGLRKQLVLSFKLMIDYILAINRSNHNLRLMFLLEPKSPYLSDRVKAQTLKE